jgi:hypothetical protein
MFLFSIASIAAQYHGRVMSEELRKIRNVIAGVANVSVRDDAYGTVDATTTDGRIVSLDFPMRSLAPMIMALFSAASALQERRYAVKRERAVVALPVQDAAAVAITARGTRHVVISLKLENDAIFRFSLPLGAATRLSRSLVEAVGHGPN